MSWVAEKNTIATAQAVIGASARAGFCSANSAMVAPSAAWRAARSKIVVHEERCVIREAPLRVYRGGARLAGERAAHHLVVDAPADVVGARPPAVRPPGIQIRLGSHLAERVHVPAPAKHMVHPGALLGQEPGVLPARPP